MTKAPPDKLIEWWRDPILFVLECFGEGYHRETGKDLEAELEAWHRRALGYLVRHAPHDWCDGLPAKGIALRGAKGIGKSAWESWVAWWFFTKLYANIYELSITRDNLRDNLWKENARWYGRSAFLQKAYEFRGERIVPRGVERDKEDQWYISQRSFPANPDKDEQTAAVQGLHGDHVAIFIDEAGEVPPGVVMAAEGIHANPVDSLVVTAGNTNSMEGGLYYSSVKQAHRYHVVKVTSDPLDPERSLRTDPKYAQALIDDGGREDPLVMINVLAEFPAQGITKLLGEADIQKSLTRKIAQRDHEQEVKVASLDIARHGLDSSVYTLRQGPFLTPQTKWRIPDLMVLADHVALKIEEDDPDALIVLATGIGWGVVDRLRQKGYGPKLIAIDEGTDAVDSRFGNRRAEMWWNAAEWVRSYGHLVEDPELKADLLSMGWRERFYKGKTRILVDPAEVVRQDLGRSPDKGTSFCGTFAATVASRRMRMLQQQQFVESAADPWAAMRG